MLHTPTIHVARDATHLAWDPAIPPVATVSSGDIVGFDCLDASNGQLTADSVTADLETLVFDQVDQVNGPVEVAGAEPGDSLQIDILELEPANWGWTANIPGFGLLADDFPAPFYKVTRCPGPSGLAEFWPGVHVPLAPFCGEMGVAPLSGPAEHDPARPPWRQHGHPPPGGRFDAVPAGVRAGRPVLDRRWPRDAGRRRGVRDGHRDADAGDGPPHRAQGRSRVGRRSSSPPPTRTRSFASGRRYATDGIGPDLLTAARDALRRMIDWLGREHGLSAVEAYLLCSVAVDLRISEIVDVPNFVVTAHCPLGLFDSLVRAN